MTSLRQRRATGCCCRCLRSSALVAQVRLGWPARAETMRWKASSTMTIGSRSTSRLNISGRRWASRAITTPPVEWPTPITPERPRCSQKAARSSARSRRRVPPWSPVAAAVPAGVHGDNAESRAQVPGDGVPASAGTHVAVEHQQRRPPVSPLDVVQGNAADAGSVAFGLGSPVYGR